jgi:photosynthetic reaction center H subunit
MPTGAITQHIDVALVVLYAFWIFFFGLIVYLQRESRREGYPLVPDQNERGRGAADRYVGLPSPKAFKLHDGRTIMVPDESRQDYREVKARPIAPWTGAPLEPTGNPMLDGVGPAAYAMREDVPELTMDGLPLITPLKVERETTVAEGDDDPRGMTVLGADRKVAGTVTDIWIDRAEPQARYLEVQIADGTSRLLPMYFLKIHGSRRTVTTNAIMAHQFADVPTNKDPGHVTKLEEDKITAYYSSGYLYASPDRLGPLL